MKAGSIIDINGTPYAIISMYKSGDNYHFSASPNLKCWRVTLRLRDHMWSVEEMDVGKELYVPTQTSEKISVVVPGFYSVAQARAYGQDAIWEFLKDGPNLEEDE